MKNLLWLGISLCCSLLSMAQKKPLDHSVYDGWKSAGERIISNNGKYVAYTITPQEGDGTLWIKALDNGYQKEIPRGYQAIISNDSRFVVFKIKPFFKDTREARIKKKKPEEMPKDSLGIIELGTDSILKIARAKTFKTPKEGIGEWLAYHLEKALPETPKPKSLPDSLTQLNNLTRIADSLVRIADSLRNKASEARAKGISVLQPAKKEGKPVTPKISDDPVEEGTELVLYNLHTGTEKRWKLVNEYYFSEEGNILVVETSRKNNDSLSAAIVLWMNTSTGQSDTVMRKFNDAKNYAIDKAGTQLAFVAERDSVSKALVKFYKLWYFKPGFDSAHLQADKNSTGISKGLTISPDFATVFSKDGKKLFFGLSPIRKPKDTTLVDFETARLDVWHFNDDYLQPQQLVQLNQELRRSYWAVSKPGTGSIIQLGGEEAETVQWGDEGNADYVLASSTRGNRVSSQWDGFSKQAAWLISTNDGNRIKVSDPKRAFYSLSPAAKYVLWYDWQARQYFTFSIATGRTVAISTRIKFPMWDEEDDHPDDPPPHGIAGWIEDDKSVLVYDRYDIWELDPTGEKAPKNLTQAVGRTTKTEMRYQKLDPDERFIKMDQQMLLRSFNQVTKYAGFSTLQYGKGETPEVISMLPNSFPSILKAKDSNRYLVQKSDIKSSELYWSSNLKQLENVTTISKQQEPYNWLTVELVKWKMFDGKESEGLLFKPENFDPAKKYPIIFYFYERDADGLYNYRAPAPSASTVNIPYFTSNGYLVFDPNIYYKNGEPGESAYNSVVSAARYFARQPYVDSTKMAIQGQSWGGYQVAYLITRTKMFAAAGAGAPVANMTSAYGGIRWGSGLNRQFQYERSQTRIGATLWQRRDLYIKNSPLFHADKITTPVLIMSNDKDGAVPWYQGIEFFTALRRLGRKVWLLQYNDEDHNLVERRNRKDLSVRLGQFFDFHLKGAPAPKWLSEGVPAVVKGIEWGL